MSADANGMFLNLLFGVLSKKISIPADFHEKVACIQEMLKDDITGLVDSLTDFAVETASVDYGISTDNSELTKALSAWLNRINQPFAGKIPSGITPLAEEFFKERWKSSSFPILKTSGWEVDPATKLILPTKMFIVDGKSVYAEDKNDGENLKVINYDYYLGNNKKNKLDKNVIFTRANGRWFDKYPEPYLIKRGIYHNWRIIKALKNNEEDILEQIIPYMLLIKKGTEKLAIEKKVNYDDKKLKKVIEQIDELAKKTNSYDPNCASPKTPVRASQFDEEIKHLIPDLQSIFNPDLFAVAERQILAGLGFIDVVDAISSTRKESVLNPKVFIQEIKTGVKDFKQLLKEVVLMVYEKNKSHSKYTNTSFNITASPIKGFMTDKFKERIRQLYDRGRISSQTTVELIGEVDFSVEVKRREEEAKAGIEFTMYPQITDNREDAGIDFSQKEKPVQVEDVEIPDAKQGQEAKNFNKSSLEDEPELVGSPYASVKALPKNVKQKLSLDLQRTWLSIFNRAFKTYDNESLAFATAWSVIRKLSRKDKTGMSVRKNKPFSKKKVELSRAMLESSLAEAEKNTIQETLDLKKLEMDGKKSTLLDIILKRAQEDE